MTLLRRVRRQGPAGLSVVAFLLLFAVPAVANEPPASWWLHLRSTAYALQTEDASGATLDRFPAYQDFDGALSGLANGKLAFRFGGRVADDLSLKEKNTDRARLYVGQIEARIDPRFTARLGRQFVQEGPTGLTLDGLWLSARPADRWQAQIWGGARAPLDRDFKAGALGDDAAWGARIAASPASFARVAASWAYRERFGRVSGRPAGLDGTIWLPHGLRASGRAVYDMERDAWEREDALLQWQRKPGCPVFSAQILDRRPDVDASSYFARFMGKYVERVRMGRTSIQYVHRTGFGAEAEYVGTFVDERTSARIGGAILAPVGRLGYSARIGDVGEESRFFGDASVRVLPWLRLEAGGALETYSLLDDVEGDAQEDDLTSVFGRARIFPRSGIGVTLEVQSVDNPTYKSDVRFLAGLDLTMGRGASRFGLDRGGWLR